MWIVEFLVRSHSGRYGRKSKKESKFKNCGPTRLNKTQCWPFWNCKLVWKCTLPPFHWWCGDALACGKRLYKDLPLVIKNKGEEWKKTENGIKLIWARKKQSTFVFCQVRGRWNHGTHYSFLFTFIFCSLSVIPGQLCTKSSLLEIKTSWIYHSDWRQMVKYPYITTACSLQHTKILENVEMQDVAEGFCTIRNVELNKEVPWSAKHQNRNPFFARSM